MSSQDVPRSNGSMLWVGVAALALLAVGLFFSLRPATMSATEAGTSPGDPLLKDWPKPVVAVVLSGEMHGYIEPCGCTSGQTGGLARRATLMKQLRADRGWNLVGLDLGGTMIPERIGRQQTKMKFEMARDALESIGFVGLGIGYEEAITRQDELLEMSERDKAQPDYDLRFTSANVRPYPDNPELDITQLYRVINVPVAGSDKPYRIVATSILGESLSKGIASDLFFKILPPAEALAEILPKMQEEQPDLLLLLSHAKADETDKLATQFPQFELMVSSGGPEEGLLKPKFVGQTQVLFVGQKGKNVGVVGVYPQGPQKFRYELVKLDGARFENDPELNTRMQDYQVRLRDERPDLVDNANAPSHPTGRTFVGSQACADCHAGSFETWSSTGHAHAFESLTTGRADHQGEWIDRKWDSECIACHTVGWEPQQALRWAGGFVDEASTPLLLNNGCENCHGPGSEHVTLENGGTATEAQLTAGREGMRLSLKGAEKTCRGCHDGDNDPHFDFEKYWPQIEHHD
ncbi:MAG: multiheme c-type cytochrome [Planctomycetaceae bacterium]